MNWKNWTGHIITLAGDDLYVEYKDAQEDGVYYQELQIVILNGKTINEDDEMASIIGGLLTAEDCERLFTKIHPVQLKLTQARS